LKDRISDPKSSDAFFQDFEEKLANFAEVKEVYLRRERVLEELDTTAWEDLKKKAVPHLTKRDKNGRGWQQLFNFLNEARAYRYLKSIGCTGVRFIPTSHTSTPDLEGALGLDQVLCEVKTINPSNEEVAARIGPPRVRSLPVEITPEFLRKLLATVEAAQRQMQVYDPSGLGAVHFVYLNVSFDDSFAECKEAYFQQIDRYLETTRVSGVRLVVCNDHTLFYKPLHMRCAHVDNDG
jgi:hypothetical protein